MDILVALGTKGDQIPFGVVPEQTPRVDMVHLKTSKRSAVLAAPPVPRQHL